MGSTTKLLRSNIQFLVFHGAGPVSFRNSILSRDCDVERDIEKDAVQRLTYFIISVLKKRR